MTAVSSFTSDTATQIVLVSPSVTAGTVDVTVSTAGGTSATSSADQYTYVAAPTVTGVSPTGGPTSGGTSVTITGTNLSNATAVHFGTAVVSSFTSDTATQIVLVSPSGAAGTVDVTVSTAGGTSATSSADQFTYVAAPTVTGVSPTAGPTSGGTSVTITGTNLSNATAVRFGTTVVSSFTSDTATQIVLLSPSGTAGTVDVTVSTAGGTSATSSADQFTYVAAPTVTGVSPTSGPTFGSTPVTITGTNLSNATAVRFGTTVVSSFTSDTATQIVLVSPAGAAGTVDVTVSTAGGTSATSSADQYTYVAAPTVTNVSPTGGPTSGGTSVTIIGTNLANATVVRFGTAVVSSFASDTATQIVLLSASATIGTVDITVATAGGTSATSPADQFTYVAAPTVTGVSPAAGPTSGGTSVTIVGTNLLNATAVHFGTTLVSSFASDTGMQIVVLSPSGAAGTVDVTVTTAGGTSAASSADQFTYVAAPTVSSVSPTSGPLVGGTSVTITGTNLLNATAVNFGANVVTSFTSDTATQIVLLSPSATAGTVDVTVTTAWGTSATSSADQFTYIAAPTVTGVSPAAGPTSGGASVTITGTNLANATAVRFGTTMVGSFTSDTSTQIVVVSPVGTAGTVDLTVTTAGGTSTTSSADQFTYVAAPTVSGVSPIAGPTFGGTSVTITGTNLSDATAVRFGTTVVSSFTSDAATQIVLLSPSGAAGTLDVTVTTAGGTSATSSADQFTYMAAPTVSGVNPIAGPTSGGTSVTITGTNLLNAAAVYFGATVVSSFTSDTATQIVLLSPAGTAGTADVTVTTAGGTSATSSADQFTYMAAPTITGVSPAAGPLAGGTSVTVTGTNLLNATAVRFGATVVSSFTSDTATQIVLLSPAGTAGTVDVTVVTAGGTSATSSADQFTYVSAPSVSAVSPTAGPTSGGTSVTITGTNLLNATSVDFGSAVVTLFTSDTGTQIVLASPSGTVGIVDVTVTTPGGTSTTSSADHFTYVSAPTVAGVSPTAGPLAGGTTVTITGMNLRNATAVHFGATVVTSFMSDTATQIVLLSPAGSPGAVDVTVTTAGGTSATSPADQFTYVAAPTVTNVSPSSGPSSGGTTVTISGTNLSNATAVRFGATLVSSIKSDTATRIVVLSPPGKPGTVNVTVTTAGGTSATSSGDHFTYGNSPQVTLSQTSLKLGTTTAGTAGLVRTYTINGTNLAGPITVVAPAGVQLSDNGGRTWKSSLTVLAAHGRVSSMTIKVRIKASALAGSISGRIRNMSPSAVVQDVAASGKVKRAT
jgi:hypothetical protein